MFQLLVEVLSVSEEGRTQGSSWGREFEEQDLTLVTSLRAEADPTGSNLMLRERIRRGTFTRAEERPKWEARVGPVTLGRVFLTEKILLSIRVSLLLT